MENEVIPQNPNSKTPVVTIPPVSEPPPPPPVVKKTAKFSIKAIVGLILFLLLAGGAAAGYIYREPLMSLVSKPTPTPAPIVTITPTPDPTADWKTYEGDGFRFKYPAALTNVDGRLRSSNYKISTGGIEMLIEGIEIRVFINNTTETMLTKALEKDPLFNEIAKEKRSKTVGGVEALQFEFRYESNQAVSTRFIDKDTLYEIQLSYSNTESKERYVETYNQILSTFKFTEQVVRPTSCKEARTGISEIVNGPFRAVYPSASAGEVDIEGTIISRKSTLYGEEYEMVYIVLNSKDNSNTYKTFLDYYVNEAKSGNTINYVEESNLMFKLGTITNGVFQTQSAVNKETVEQITKIINADVQVKLRLKVPIYQGSDVPADFSFACEYKLNP